MANDNERVSARTKWSYSVGCIGRDMNYILVNTFILYFLVRGIGLDSVALAGVTVVFMIARVWDAVNDAMMGVVVDNTRSRYGKFKPWILTGALLNAAFLVILFTDFGLNGLAFVLLFGFAYIMWDMTFTMNDIAYWSMYASFSTDTKEREKVASLARIFANVGLFTVTAGAPIIYSMVGVRNGFFLMAIVTMVIFIACQFLIVFGVKQRPNPITSKFAKTGLKDIARVIFKNDQMLALVVSMLLFTTAFYITTNLGIFFFEYDYGLYVNKMIDTTSFMVFAVVLGVTQIVALACYPLLSKRLKRRQIFTLSVILVTTGYLMFFAFSYILPKLWAFAIAGILVFAAQAFLQLLILVMLANTIEYGQLKNGKRNEGVLFSLNPFIVKMASAIQIGINSLVLATTGINDAANYIAKNYESRADEFGNFSKALYEEISQNLLSQGLINSQSVLVLRLCMFIVPLIFIVASYIVFMMSYKLDEEAYAKVLAELEAIEAAEESKERKGAPHQLDKEGCADMLEKTDSQKEPNASIDNEITEI